jgi:hypothetical protein
MSTRDIGTLVRGLIEAAKSRRRKPSERNLRIYEEVRVEGIEQAEVAALHGVSPRRVSAICQQVDRWYGEQEPWQRGELQGASDHQAERLVARRRLAHVYSWAMRGLKFSGQSLTEGHTTIPDHGPAVRKHVSRDQKFNVQWLKIAKGAAEQLLALAADDEPGEVAPPPRVARGEAMLRAVACLRRALRQEVQKVGKEGVGKLVEQVVLACIGEPGAKGLEGAPAQAVSTAGSEASGREVVARVADGQRNITGGGLRSVADGGVRAKWSNYSAAEVGDGPPREEVTASAKVASPLPPGSCEAGQKRNGTSAQVENGRGEKVRGICSSAADSGEDTGSGGETGRQGIGERPGSGGSPVDPQRATRA